VSHDRDFLDRTVTEVLAFEGEAKVQGYMGGYSDYLAAKKKALAPAKKAPEQKAPAANEGRKKSAPAMSGKLRFELEKLPGKIAALEQELVQLKEALADPDAYTKDPEKFDRASRRFATAQHELEAAETRWLELEQ